MQMEQIKIKRVDKSFPRMKLLKNKWIMYYNFEYIFKLKEYIELIIVCFQIRIYNL